MRPFFTCLVAVILGALHGPVHADDLDILGATYTSVPPNVLIIFDTSGSMNYCSSQTSTSDCTNNNDKRIQIAKNVITQLINETNPSGQQKVRFGLMTFNDETIGGGKVEVECGATNETLIQRISNFSASGYTPLGESLAEAGLYVTGKQSWFNKNSSNALIQYTSPVQYSCQNNFIIVMTDGIPTKDVDVKLESTNYLLGTKIGDYDQDKVGVTCGSGGGGDGGGSWGGSGGSWGGSGGSWGGSGDTTAPVEHCYHDTATNTYKLYDSEGSDYLDDVAYYLSNKLNFSGSLTTLTNGTNVKPIKTFTIGFSAPEAATLLTQTAANGGGQYYTASNAQQLKDAFNQILNTIMESNSTYTSPTIPRNPNNQTDVGDRVYMAFFKPQASGRWIGNLKAYGLVNGELKDSTGQPATYASGPNQGQIKDTARSYWSTVADGLNVDYGGAGEKLAGDPGPARYVYTYTGTQPGLEHPHNKFTDGNNNPQLTTTMFGVTTAAGLDAVVSKTLAGVTVKHSDGTTVANWRLGDIIHSEPVVKYYQDPNNNSKVDANEPRSYIFVGANDGMLHVFYAANGYTSDGNEAWAFVPPGQLPRLKDLVSGDGVHRYGVDGSPVVEAVKTQEKVVDKDDPTKITFIPKTIQLLLFGERRGGASYYALDVSNPDKPVWKYQLTDKLLTALDWDGNGSPDGTAATLGQSWAKPQFKLVRSGGKTREAFLLAGGYDTNQDLTTPAANDTVGRAIYTIAACHPKNDSNNPAERDPACTDPPTVFGLNINAGNYPEMTHSIIDVTAFDKAGQGYIDRVYAGDLGGHMFAAKYDGCAALTSGCVGGWRPRVLFDIPDGPVGGILFGQKVMTRPEVVLEPGKECVYFGTGDREHPNEKTKSVVSGTTTTTYNVVDAIYAVCNNWTNASPLSTSNLSDVTSSYTQLTDGSNKWVYNPPTSSYGWYMRLTNPGEKLVSSLKVLNGKLYFATFTPGTPGSGTTSTDPCTATYNYGTSRMYALNHKTGAAAYNFNADDQWTQEDRSKVIGTSIAGDPVLTTSGEETSIFYGSGGKFEGMPVETAPIVKRYYWRQIK